MPNTSLSWLDFNARTLSQAVQHWHLHHDEVALGAWLLSGHHVVGDVTVLTAPLMQEFVEGIKRCDMDNVGSCPLPTDWPKHSMEETQYLRDILTQVHWDHMTVDQPENVISMGLLNVLYPSPEHRHALATGNYSADTEHSRLYIGFPMNDMWWQRLPLMNQADREANKEYGRWSNLLSSVAGQDHPRKGLYMALLLEPAKELEKEQLERCDDLTFLVPSIEQIIQSNVPGKMAMAMSQAVYCPRDKIPDPQWWTSWDDWCAQEPQEAQLALASLLLSRVGDLEAAPDAGDLATRNGLVRMASLRNPSASYSIAHVMSERRKYEHYSLDELLEMALPISERQFRLFEGIASCQEQLILCYQKLQQQPQPELGLNGEQMGDLLVGS